MRNNEQGIDQQEQGSQAETPAILDGHPRAEEDKKPAGSSRKVETNRRNALKSTGPKTAAGKERVSQNATKHGFYSKWLLVKHQDGEESQAEYDKFYSEIAEYFQPYG